MCLAGVVREERARLELAAATNLVKSALSEFDRVLRYVEVLDEITTAFWRGVEHERVASGAAPHGVAPGPAEQRVVDIVADERIRRAPSVDIDRQLRPVLVEAERSGQG